MYKIIALDLDGTLLDSKKKISDVNKKALKDASDNGIKVVIATGRPYQGVQHIIKELNLENTDNYVMCFNGGLIYHLLTNTPIYNASLTGKEVKKLYNESLELNINIHAFTSSQQLIAPKQSEYTDHEANINKITTEYTNFNLLKDEDIFIKAMLVDPVDKVDSILDKIDPIWYSEYSVVRSAPFFLEFLNIKAQKGVALEALAKHLGYTIEQTVAFGDAENDLSMISMAGLGVCMSNGMPKVLEIADYVTKSNDEDGVAYAIYEKILK